MSFGTEDVFFQTLLPNLYIKEGTMQYVIAVYRSRNVSMQAYNFLLRNRIVAALVSTPRSINVGCGLSVKFAYSNLSAVSNVLSQGETFVGFFLVKNTLNGTTVSRL